MLGTLYGQSSKNLSACFFSCPPVMYLFVVTTVYVCCYSPLSLGGNFLEAVLARRPPIISVEGREMDRSGNFERRSLFSQ